MKDNFVKLDYDAIVLCFSGYKTNDIDARAANAFKLRQAQKHKPGNNGSGM